MRRISKSRLDLVEKKLRAKNPDKLFKKVPHNWVHFISLTSIRSGGKIKHFIPYKYQELISWLMDEYQNVEIIKSRQTGLTQCATGKFIHRAALNPAYSAISFMRNQDDSSALARRARQMVTCLNEYFTTDSDSLGYLKLKNLGELYFKNSSKEGSRSYDSVSDFLFDEAAFSENIAAIYASSSPSTALVGDLITKLVISTPGARSGWYWDKINTGNPSKYSDVQTICDSVADGKLSKDIALVRT